MEFCEIIDEATSCEKTSCQTLVRQLVFWLLVVSNFNYLKMHAWSTSTLLLLHSSFMLSEVKRLLKGEIGVRALNSHGNYIVDHGKLWNCVFEFLWEPCLGVLEKSLNFTHTCLYEPCSDNAESIHSHQTNCPCDVTNQREVTGCLKKSREVTSIINFLP